MRSSSLKRSIPNYSEHGFLQTPRSRRRSVQEKQKISTDIKSRYISQLEERNMKLKYEIIKIHEMLDEQKEKSSNKKQYKLIPHQSSSQVLKQQLENVQKQIKSYEREIRSLEMKQSGGLVAEKMEDLEAVLRERSKHLNKLKNQLTLCTKNSVENGKKLQNNAGKEELENVMLKYNLEIKGLREKVKEAEDKQKKKQQNARKQLDYIKELERQLTEQYGISSQEMDILKNKNIYNQIHEKMHGGNTLSANSLKSPKNSKEEAVEDITINKYTELKNEIKLYTKLQIDYDKRLQALQKEKESQEQQCNSIKVKLNDKQQEINKLQEEISELKGKVKRHNLRPNHNVTKSAQEVEKMKQKMRMSPGKQKSGIISERVKKDEKGQVTAKGQRFNDAATVGKNVNSKIISVKIWTEKNTLAINGIQCVYKIGDKIKEGPQHISKDVKKHCVENIMELADGDYVKSISGHISQANIIEYLVFISKNSVISRFGTPNQNQKQFNFDIDEDQIPIWLYGSMYQIKEGKKEKSVIENIGFAIYRDQSLNKDDKYI